MVRLHQLKFYQIVDAVGRKIEIHIDGIRSGQDVVKALCLGEKVLT